MTGAEFKAACKERGLTYPKAAELLGKAVPTIKMYATNKRTIPAEVEEKLAGSVSAEPEASVPNQSLAALRREVSLLREENERLRNKLAVLEEVKKKKKQSCSASVMGLVRRGPPVSSLGKKSLRSGLRGQEES